MGEATYTIGYGNQPLKRFLGKLIQYKIDVLVDVRSKPHSRHAQYNRKALQASVEMLGIHYLYLGNALGGLGENEGFDEAIAYVTRMSDGGVRACLTCAEEKSSACHRSKTLAPALKKLGIEIVHIEYEHELSD